MAAELSKKAPDPHVRRVPAEGEPVYLWAVSLAAKNVNPDDERAIVMARDLLVWVQVVSRFKDKCEVFRSAEKGHPDDLQLELARSIEAGLGNRSPFTVHKRANAFMHFLRWIDKTFPDVLADVKERAYVSFLKASGAAPTKASSFLSSLRFAKHVLGVDLDSLVFSKRVEGLSSQMFAQKRSLRQAAVLTVEQVKILHRKLQHQSLHPYDRALVAAMIIRLYGRARNSDLHFIVKVDLDLEGRFGFLELLISQHKGARTAALKARYLPILAPTSGVDAVLDTSRDRCLRISGEASGVIEGTSSSGSEGCFRFVLRG